MDQTTETVSEDGLPLDTVFISINEETQEPIIGVRGVFADMAEAEAVLEYTLARVRYMRFRESQQGRS